MYAQDSIDLLQNSGLQFKKHEEDGIEPVKFAELLMTSGIVLFDNIKMLSFHRLLICLCDIAEFISAPLKSCPYNVSAEDIFAILYMRLALYSLLVIIHLFVSCCNAFSIKVKLLTKKNVCTLQWV